MSLKENKEFIIIIIGVILTLTVIGAIAGIPMILIGGYLLNKKAQNPLQSEVDKVNKEIQEKEKIIQQYNEQIGVNQTLTEKREEIDNINQRLATLEQEKTEEINQKLSKTLEELQQTKEQLTEKQAKLKEIENKYNITEELVERKEELEDINTEIRAKRKKVEILDDAIDMQEYGIYEPQYNFTKSEEYKDKLKEVRDEQKQMIKDKRAALCTQEWTIDGSVKKEDANVLAENIIATEMNYFPYYLNGYKDIRRLIYEYGVDVSILPFHSLEDITIKQMCNDGIITQSEYEGLLLLNNRKTTLTSKEERKLLDLFGYNNYSSIEDVIKDKFSKYVKKNKAIISNDNYSFLPDGMLFLNQFLVDIF